MTENKMSLADAAKKLLAQKKEAQMNAKSQKHGGPNSSQQMKSQIKKKPNNQKRRTGV